MERGEDPLASGESWSSPRASGGREYPGARLFGFSRGDFVGLGAILFVIGIVVLIAGAVYMFSTPPMPNPTGDFQQDSQAMDSWFQESKAHGLGGFAGVAVGMVLLAVGGMALRFGLIRPVTSFVAAEASPAIQTAAEAVGRGLSESGVATRTGGAAATPAAQTVVKVKCKNCGYLDSEDATFCSKCGQPL